MRSRSLGSVVGGICWLWAASAAGQTEAAPIGTGGAGDAGAFVVEAEGTAKVDLAGWISRLRRDEADAKQLEASLAGSEIGRIERRWPELREETAQDLADLVSALESDGADLDILRDTLAVAERQLGEIVRLVSDTEAEAVRLDGLHARATELQQTWTKVAAQPGEKVHAEFLPLIQTILATADRVERDIGARKDRFAALVHALTNTETSLKATIEQAQARLGSQLGQGLFSWSRSILAELRSIRFAGSLARGAERWRLNYDVWLEYAKDHSGSYALQVILTLVSFSWLRGSRKRVGQLEPSPAFRDLIDAVLERPLAAAILIGAAVSTFLHDAPPALHVGMIESLALLAAVRLGWVALPGAPRALAWLTPLMLVEWVRILMLGLTALGRLTMIAELSALLFLFWKVGHYATTPRYRQLGLRILQAVGAISMVAIAADLVGFAVLARRLGTGALNATFLIVVCVVAYWAILGTVAALLHAPWTANVRALDQRRGAVLGWLVSLAHIVLPISWIAVTLFAFRVEAYAGKVLGAIWNASIHFGEVTVSVGDLLTFGIVIWSSIYLSRVLRALLEDDVLARTELPSGVPYAISMTTHYLVILFGGFLALSAAGLSVTRFTVLAGAIGVGIGFGLQGVVNNIICGLILLYERPIRVQDIIQVDGVEGEVKHIGIRSSTVRTWPGADVLVPNATLINSTVTNFTLKDRERRLDIAVGVAYGTSATDVLKILIDVANSNSQVLKEPQAVALFMGFGESTLNFELRAWVAEYIDGFVLKSDLAVAVVEALDRAGIEIPLPQRELRLRSVAEGILPVPAPHGRQNG